MPNNEEYINKMYDSALESQKQQLEQDYQQGTADLEAQQERARKQTDQNLTRTYVEAAKAQKNYAEAQNAYGLTSGAMAQARLAQDNQLQGNLTAIRTAHQDVDAEIERERGILAKEYAAAIQKAQADNDLARAQALYEAAQAEEERLRQLQQQAGNIMAGAGDYSRLAQLYGLTEEELALLNEQGNTRGGGGGGGGGASEDAVLEQLYAQILAETEEERRRENSAPTGGGGGGRAPVRAALAFG